MLHNLVKSSFDTSKVPVDSWIFSNCFKYLPETSLYNVSFSFRPNHSKTPLSPREELHLLHDRTRLSADSSPPLFRGIIWSVVRFSLPPQKTHSLGNFCSLSHSLIVSEIFISPLINCLYRLVINPNWRDP
jgi:hypothetical protein